MPQLTPRHADILRLVREKGTITIADLAGVLSVSEETIRRDVRPLAEKGEIVKLHGAIALPHQVGEAPFERRLRVNAEAKRAIARHAARLIGDGDSLMLDTGTTTSIFARELLRKRNLTVVTNSSDIARTLATVNGNRVYMAGGELNGDNGAAFGTSAVQFVSTFRVRHAFISIGALDALAGPTDDYLAEAEFARMVLSCGDNRYILTDSSKFGRTALIRVCGFSDIDLLISEKAPPGDLAEVLAQAGVRFEAT
ncbi:MAG: DeoR/GlpR transcriptional regulator [Alphaproteobacteria bacterium]|nr:DeoR/GlpR transcriptional regulator [Alphaproteobacteria bacterium]